MNTLLRNLIGVALLLAMLNFTANAQQPTILTYQGRVSSNGTNFTGVGQFKFVLVTSTNANHTATATANPPSGGYITGYTVTFGGNGYVTPPTVNVFGGGGTGATAHANISGGAVTSISVDNTGNGNYTSAPYVLIAPPPPNLTYYTFWSNDGTGGANGGEPSGAVTVAVSNGVFTVRLGDTTQPNMLTLDASTFSQTNLQLRIWFSDGVHGFAPLDPAQNLTATPYSDSSTFANYANTAGTANAVTSPSGLSGTYSSAVNFVNSGNTFTGNGAGLTGLNATQLSGPVPSSSLDNAWKINGNSSANPTNGAFIGTIDNLPFELRVNGMRGLRIEPATNGAPNIIAGSPGNFVSPNAYAATIAGGGGTNIPGYGFAINKVTDNYGAVGGGIQNSAAYGAVVGGGISNVVSGAFSFIGSGVQNSISGGWSTVGGGNYNTVSGSYAVIPGGANNIAAGTYSFAAGSSAQALHYGSFVWADASHGLPYASTANNQFSVYAYGGIRLAGDVSLTGGNDYHNLSMSGGNSTGYLYGSYHAYADGIHLGYNYYADNAGTGHVINSGGATSRLSAGYGFVDVYVGAVGGAPNSQVMHVDSTGITGVIHNTSDRNVKHGFSAINPSQILEKVSALPLSEWSYDSDPKTRHIGPMAQDFHAAFNVGIDDKHITSIDEAGVAFASIQALNQKITALSEQLQLRDEENADLKARLEKLEQLIGKSQK